MPEAVHSSSDVLPGAVDPAAGVTSAWQAVDCAAHVALRAQRTHGLLQRQLQSAYAANTALAAQLASLPCPSGASDAPPTPYEAAVASRDAAYEAHMQDARALRDELKRQQEATTHGTAFFAWLDEVCAVEAAAQARCDAQAPGDSRALHQDTTQMARELLMPRSVLRCADEELNEACAPALMPRHAVASHLSPPQALIHVCSVHTWRAPGDCCVVQWREEADEMAARALRGVRSCIVSAADMGGGQPRSSASELSLDREPYKELPCVPSMDTIQRGVQFEVLRGLCPTALLENLCTCRRACSAPACRTSWCGQVNAQIALVTIAWLLQLSRRSDVTHSARSSGCDGLEGGDASFKLAQQPQFPLRRNVSADKLDLYVGSRPGDPHTVCHGSSQDIKRCAMLSQLSLAKKKVV